jgi:hypothetical protein
MVRGLTSVAEISGASYLIGLIPSNLNGSVDFESADGLDEFEEYSSTNKSSSAPSHAPGQAKMQAAMTNHSGHHRMSNCVRLPRIGPKMKFSVRMRLLTNEVNPGGDITMEVGNIGTGR